MTTTFDKRKLRGGACQALVFVLTQALVVTSVPTQAAPPQEAKQAVEERAPEKPAPKPPVAKVKVNKTRPRVDPVPQTPVFSNPPKDQDFFRARVFAEPFVPIGQTTVEENRAFAQALLAYHGGKDNENVAPLGLFLNNYPNTAWRASLLTNLGIHYHRTGYFTAAIQTLTEAWNLGKESRERYPSAIANRAIGELLDVHMKFGQVEELEKLYAQVQGRDLHGEVVEKVSSARRAIYVLREKHHEALASAAIAVNQYLSQGKPGYKQHPELAKFHAKQEGVSLAEMLDLTRKTGLKMEMVQRPSGQTEVVVPSIVHLNQGHFAALVKEENGRYLLSDPILGSNDVWLSRAALLQEVSGYFLVAEGKTPEGWSRPRASDVERVRGKCFTWNIGFGEKGGPTCEECRGMATYSLDGFFASLRIVDTPVGYSPPRGAAVDFTVRYHQREVSQPQVFTFSNLGPRWNFSWLSYIEDDPNNLSAPVYTFVRGGWRETSSGPTSGTYPPHIHSRAVVVRTGSSPIAYERRLPDGSKEVFSQSDGGVSPRRVFLTALVDPHGNSLTVTYDGSLRVVSVTDSLSQVTTLTYGLQGDPLKITKVTDPFGRSATLEYNAAGALIRITDVIGIVSEMEYGLTDLVSSLTTPYGTTSFSQATPQAEAGVYYADPWLEATDPLGGKERVQFRWGTSTLPATDPSNTVPTGFSNNADLNIWNSYYWDKRAMALHPGDYTKARSWRWLAMKLGTLTAVAHSEKKPLEGRVWYEQVGETFVNQAGPLGRPAKIGRVLDDGSSQITRHEWNAVGMQTRESDPLGRETVYVYGTESTPDADQATGSGIDLLQVKQKNGSTYDLLQTATYNSDRRPLTTFDASGQTTTYTYNAAGQVLTVVTPARSGISENRTTTYDYDADGYLESVTGAAMGATTSYTYDDYGRVETTADPDSHVLTFEYDALDRRTKVTYPDSTFEETVYDRLDVGARRDRLGLWTKSFHDPLRRVVATTDPLGRTTSFQWCTCGSMDKLIDANGNSTRWERDLQGRVTSEIRANSSSKDYVYEDTTSRLKQVTDAKSQVIGYEYWNDNTLKEITFADEEHATADVSFTYDNKYNRRTTMADGTGTTTWTYNAISDPPGLGSGRVASVDGPAANDTIAYTYDESGRVKVRTVNASANSQTYAFDALGRVTSQVNVLGTFTYGYEGTTGRLDTVTYPNGQTTEYAYEDNAGDHRLEEIHHKLSGGATLSKFNYTTDAMGSIKTWSQQTGGSSPNLYTLGYDSADQLTSAVLTDSTPAIVKRYAYGYDKAGNRKTEQIDDAVTTATFDSMNRLTDQNPGGLLTFKGSVSEAGTVSVQGNPATVTGANDFEGKAEVGTGTTSVAVQATDASSNVRTNTYEVDQSGSSKSLTHDGNGNLTGDGTNTFEWDAENRLLRVCTGTCGGGSDPGNMLARFVYDGLGRRYQKIAGGTTRTYIWDGQQVAEEGTASGIVRYFEATGIDRWIGRQNADASATYIVGDHLGSVTQQTNSGGTVTLARSYDPWGNLDSTSAATSGPAFTGREWDAEIQLHYYRARYYDPTIGRFLREDPIRFKGGLNFYTYVQNNPTNWTDPTGLLTTSQASCLSTFTTLGAMGGFMAGGGFGAAATAGTGGLAFPTIPPAAAGGAAMGGALGGAIGLIVCQIPPPTICERRMEPEGPGPERENACWAAYVTCVKAAQAAGKSHVLCDLALKKCLDHPDIPVIFPGNF